MSSTKKSRLALALLPALLTGITFVGVDAANAGPPSLGIPHARAATPSPLSRGAHDVTINGISTHYEVAGQGPVLVIQSPSWGIGSAYLFNGLAPLARDFTLVAYDTPGSGSSQKPGDLQPLTSNEIADHLEALRRHWKIDAFDLLGHSQGSALAIAYASRYPASVRNLVLVGSQLYGFSGGTAAAALDKVRREDPRFKRAVDAMDSPTPAADDQYTDRFIRSSPYYLYDPDKDTAAFVKTLTKPLSAWPSNTPSKSRAPIDQTLLLPLITARTLVVEGREDPVCPVPVSERIRQGIDKSRLVVYENTGHFPWIEQPTRFFDDVAAFLKETP